MPTGLDIGLSILAGLVVVAILTIIEACRRD